MDGDGYRGKDTRPHTGILWKELVPTLIGESVNRIVPRDYYLNVVPKMMSFICQMNRFKLGDVVL
jgi:hypothetical protein